MWDPYAHFQSTTLANGLSVHVLHWPDRAGVYFGFGIHSGAAQDLPGKEGSAHFMEHMTSCNISVTPDALNEFFELNSGLEPMLGITGFSDTVYGFRSAAEPELVRKSLQLFGEMLITASLSRHMERERGVIVGEFKKCFPTTLSYDLQRQMVESVFPNTVRMRMLRPLGTIETIRSLTEADLQRFYDTQYVPANMSVVVVGELPFDDVIAHLERSPFGLAKEGRRTPLPVLSTSAPLPRDTLVEVDLSEHLQGVTAAGYETVAQLPGMLTPHQLNLFGSMAERALYRAIREDRSWAYHVHVSSSSLCDVNEFHVQIMGLEPTALPDIESVITAVIDDLPNQTDLFERAKKLSEINLQMCDFSMLDVRRCALNGLLLEGRILTVEEDAALRASMQLSDIAMISAGLSRERRRTLLFKP